MSEYIEIHWTCGTIDEARRVVRFLVQERLVACAQIIPWIESVYMWNNQLETAQESKVVMKTVRENYEAVKKMIRKNARYEVPEITFISIDGGNEEYMNWLKDTHVAAH